MPKTKVIGNRRYCIHCESSISRSHYYSFGHNKGLCINIKKHSALNTNKLHIQKDLDGIVEEKHNHPEEQKEYHQSPLEIFDDDGDIELANTNTAESSSADDGSNYDFSSDLESDSELDEIDESTESETEDSSTHSTQTISTCSKCLMMILRAIFLFQIHAFISNSSVVLLLGMIKTVISLISTIAGIDVLCTFANEFPLTLYSAYKKAGISVDDYETWVVCPQCNTLYKFENCFKKTKGSQKKTIKSCSYTPPFTRGVKCDTKLLKVRYTAAGNTTYVPKKVYCTRGIDSTIQNYLKRPNFKKLLLESKDQVSEDGTMNDIYDGKIWQNFSKDKGEWFFKDKRNLGLMMNIDWFQPFTNSDYSLGVIYMVILNLPREERFKYENMIVCGIIPGPKEPAKHVNTFLKPIVADLLKGWNGVMLKDGALFGKSLYKFALVCLSSDIPATRKCCGFLGFSARKGCSKCFKTFPTKKFEKNRIIQALTAKISI
ncbi:uncharacterized protein [Clytia hemisphaerica]|eukprot:TCONS_00028973-protein